MATETQAETAPDSTEETSGQAVDNNTGTEDTTAETADTGTTEEPTGQQEERLPDDHPLVKAYAGTQDKLRQLKDSHQTKVQELESQVTTLTTKATEADAVQARYTRLESFLTALGGPVSKALDSKSFSTALFETDTDVTELVAQWHRDNPSATSSALNSGSGSTASSKDMNALLRQAAK